MATIRVHPLNPPNPGSILAYSNEHTFVVVDS
jgi:hypothetical protein